MATGFYIGVDGKARKIKGGYIGIDGKARKIKKGYIGDENGVARLCWTAVDPVFANNPWVEIIEACQSGGVPDSWAVGDQKTMTIDGVDYAIDIIDKDHDDYSDGSGKAPLTFQIHDCYRTNYTMHHSSTNTTGWTSCAMRTTHLPSILALMPNDVQSAIREVNKLTSAGNASNTIKSTADKLFLLSEIEIIGVNGYSKSGEGTQYAYYANGGSTIKKLSNSPTYWWERSPYSGDPERYCLIDTSGKYSCTYPTVANGVSFAFCF